MESEQRRRAVNPAARRDAPAPPEEHERPRERPEEAQVEPTQTEPLDPLNPGGIGG